MANNFFNKNICHRCKKTFYGGNRSLYCKKCRTKKCEYCKKEFIVSSCRIDTARYCSAKCTLKANPPNQKNIKRNYGKDHHNYKGGSLSSHGYRKICIKGKQVYEHRHIMEQYLGRKLKKQEHVHHINENKTDNRIKNLQIISASKHQLQNIKKGVITTCRKCGEKFHAPYYSSFYCRKCLTHICEICRKSFIINKNHIKRPNRFCSNKCRDIWLSMK